MIDEVVDELFVAMVVAMLLLLQMVELDAEPADEDEELVVVSLMRKTL